MGGRCKALLSLGGRELIRYSLDLFDRSESIQGVCVVVPGDLLERFRREMGPRWGYHKIIGWVAGGARRQDSVAAALKMIPDDVSLIAVHDAARPFATEELLDRLIDEANATGAAIPAIEVVDTIKEIDGSGRVVRSLAREKLRAVQTPQVFAGELLRDAYRHAEEKGITVTDDASLIEMMGHEVGVVEGSRDNIKITVLGDIERAKGILKSQIPNPKSQKNVDCGV